MVPVASMKSPVSRSLICLMSSKSVEGLDCLISGKFVVDLTFSAECAIMEG